MTRAESDRTVNAVLYFAGHTANCTGYKLFKLLYLLDVESFQATGRRVTGLRYGAYTPGPCPFELKHVLEEMPQAFSSRLKVEKYELNGKKRQVFFASGAVAFSGDHFSRRQMAMMTGLADRFRDVLREEIDVSAFDNGAYSKALKRGREQEVRFEETVSDNDPHRDDILAISADAAARRHYLQLAA